MARKGRDKMSKAKKFSKKPAGFKSIEDDSDSWSDISSEEEEKPKKVRADRPKDTQPAKDQPMEEEFAYSKPSVSHIKNKHKNTYHPLVRLLTFLTNGTE